MTDVRSDLDESLLQTTDRCCSFRIGWYLPFHLGQPESNGSDLLENAIVQLSGDSHPLRLLRFDQLFGQCANLGLAPFESADAKLINGPEQGQEDDCAERAEPARLVVSGWNRKVQQRALLVPHTAVIASHHAEAIVAWRKIRVLHSALVDHLSPVLVLAFELEAEAHFLRHNEAQRRVINREIPNVRRQPQAR